METAVMRAPRRVMAFEKARIGRNNVWRFELRIGVIRRRVLLGYGTWFVLLCGLWRWRVHLTVGQVLLGRLPPSASLSPAGAQTGIFQHRQGWRSSYEGARETGGLVYDGFAADRSSRSIGRLREPPAFSSGGAAGYLAVGANSALVRSRGGGEEEEGVESYGIPQAMGFEETTASSHEGAEATLSSFDWVGAMDTMVNATVAAPSVNAPRPVSELAEIPAEGLSALPSSLGHLQQAVFGGMSSGSSKYLRLRDWILDAIQDEEEAEGDTGLLVEEDDGEDTETGEVNDDGGGREEESEGKAENNTDNSTSNLREQTRTASQLLPTAIRVTAVGETISFSLSDDNEKKNSSTAPLGSGSSNSTISSSSSSSLPGKDAPTGASSSSSSSSSSTARPTEVRREEEPDSLDKNRTNARVGGRRPPGNRTQTNQLPKARRSKNYTLDAVMEEQDLSTLASALRSSDLYTGNGVSTRLAMTLFAPVDSAFEDLSFGLPDTEGRSPPPATSAQEPMSDMGMGGLGEVIGNEEPLEMPNEEKIQATAFMFHIVAPRIVSPRKLKLGETFSVASRNGQMLNITRRNDTEGFRSIFVNGVQVLDVIQTKRGFIYKIQEFLMPRWNPGPNLVDWLASAPGFSRTRFLLSRLPALQDSIKTAGPLTMFLVPDSGWVLPDGQEIPQCVFDTLVQPENYRYLESMFLWMTLPGLWNRTLIEDRDWLPIISGTPKLSVAHVRHSGAGYQGPDIPTDFPYHHHPAIPPLHDSLDSSYHNTKHQHPYGHPIAVPASSSSSSSSSAFPETVYPSAYHETLQLANNESEGFVFQQYTPLSHSSSDLSRHRPRLRPASHIRFLQPSGDNSSSLPGEALPRNRSSGQNRTRQTTGAGRGSASKETEGEEEEEEDKLEEEKTRDAVTFVEGQQVLEWDIPVFNGIVHVLSAAPLRPDIDLFPAAFWKCVDSFCYECPLLAGGALGYLDSWGTMPGPSPELFSAPERVRPDWVCKGNPSWYPPGWEAASWYRYIKAAQKQDSPKSLEKVRRHAMDGWRKAAIEVQHIQHRYDEINRRAEMSRVYYGDGQGTVKKLQNFGYWAMKFTDKRGGRNPVQCKGEEKELKIAHKVTMRSAKWIWPDDGAHDRSFKALL